MSGAARWPGPAASLPLIVHSRRSVGGDQGDAADDGLASIVVPAENVGSQRAVLGWRLPAAPCHCPRGERLHTMKLRRPWIAAIPVLVVALGVSAVTALDAQKRPNVLFIAIDDLNDWVGPLSRRLGGHPRVRTPHLDRLAGRGVTFLNAHCQSPLCNPSRTSLLTGLRPTTTGVYALGPWFRTLPQYADWTTLPQYFQRNGYVTLTTGKVYHDAYPPRALRRDGPEFSVWGFPGGFRPRPERPFVEGTGHPLVDWGVFPERDEEQDDWKVADWAIERLKSPPEGKPFFLCVGFRHPHVPLYATQRWFDLYPETDQLLPPVLADDRDDTPRASWFLHWRLPEPRLAWLRARDQWEPKVRAYLASVSFVDSLVGRLLDTLESEGLAEETVVVLWSDHGYHLGEKLITGKNTLWRESTRVPLVFAGPGVARGLTCSRPAELVDLYPTLVELCGLPARAGLDGHSLVPQLTDPSAPRPWPAICSHGPGNDAVIDEQWRYIRYADGSEELYDTVADPREWHNVAGDPAHAAARQRLVSQLPESAPPAPGSKVRLIERIDGVPYWEGKPIRPDDPIPEHIE